MGPRPSPAWLRRSPASHSRVKSSLPAANVSLSFSAAGPGARLLDSSPKVKAATTAFPRLSEFAGLMAHSPKSSYQFFPSSKRIRADDFAASVGGEGAVNAGLDVGEDEVDAAVAKDEVAAAGMGAAEAADVVGPRRDSVAGIGAAAGVRRAPATRA